MKKQIHILEGLMILVIVFIAFLLVSKFIYNIRHEVIDTTYMWNIGFDNLNVIEGSKGDISLEGEVISLNVVLQEYNEYAEFYIDIVNKGTIDAELRDYVLEVSNPSNILGYIVTYEDGREIGKGDVVRTNDKETIHVKITYPPQENKIYAELELRLSLSMHYGVLNY